MPVYDGMLMRDSLDDDGRVPSPGYMYWSPDVICHEQVADPQTFFSDNYGTDPNRDIQTGSAVNPVYVRAKNLSTKRLSGWKVFLYRSEPSLFLDPRVWRQYSLRTAGGSTFARLPDVDPQRIAVGQEWFALSGLSARHFCLIGVATDEDLPRIPESFATYDEYVMWVRRNQNVCHRNVTLVRDFRDRQYERLDGFSNPESESVPVTFTLWLAGSVPAGTRFGLDCELLGIRRVSWDISQGARQVVSAMAPAGFRGYVTSWASLPPERPRWAMGWHLDTHAYAILPRHVQSAVYAVPPEELGLHAAAVGDIEPDGVVVEIGNSSTLFETS